MVKLHINFERNRTIPGYVIYDLSFFPRVDFNSTPQTEVHQTASNSERIEIHHRCTKRDTLGYRLVLRFEMRAVQEE